MLVLLFHEKHQCYTVTEDFDEIMDHTGPFIELDKSDIFEDGFYSSINEYMRSKIKEVHPEKFVHIVWYEDRSSKGGQIKRMFLTDIKVLDNLYNTSDYMDQYKKDEALVCCSKDEAEELSGFWLCWNGYIGNVTMEICGKLYREGTLVKVKKAKYKSLDMPYAKKFLDYHESSCKRSDEVHHDSSALTDEDLMTKYGTLELEYIS